jgi:hypothetical protein
LANPGTDTEFVESNQMRNIVQADSVFCRWVRHDASIAAGAFWGREASPRGAKDSRGPGPRPACPSLNLTRAYPGTSAGADLYRPGARALTLEFGSLVDGAAMRADQAFRPTEGFE